MHVVSLSPFVGRLRTLSDLSLLSDGALRDRIGDLRAKGKIAILDDDASDPIYGDLRRSGYNISLYREFGDLGMRGAYAIYICDIRGVVSGSILEGAYAIQEIRKSNPTAYIICRSAASANDKRLIAGAKLSDKVISKSSADLSDVVIALDEAILEMTSPVRYWKRLQRFLLGVEASSLEVALLEHYWVLASMHRDPKRFEVGFQKVCRSSGLDLAPIVVDSAKIALEVGAKLVLGLPK